MIDDVTRTLRSILDDPAIESACKDLFDADVLFDRPAEQFKPVRSTVDLFLYDVRENMEMRNNEPLIERNNGKAISQRPPLRVSCSYLVTAWAPADSEEALLTEHRLLSQTLQVLSRYAVLPIDLSPPESPLKKQTPPLPMRITHMDGVKDPADFWSAIGGKLRPSFVLTVTISLPVLEPRGPETALVTGRRIDVGERTSPDEKAILPGTLGSAELNDMFRIFGTVADDKGTPMKDAVVMISELGLKVTTDKDGRYALGLVPKGKHTLRVEPGWKGSKLKSRDLPIVVSASAEHDVQLNK